MQSHNIAWSKNGNPYNKSFKLPLGTRTTPLDPTLKMRSDAIKDSKMKEKLAKGNLGSFFKHQFSQGRRGDCVRLRKMVEELPECEILTKRVNNKV